MLKILPTIWRVSLASSAICFAALAPGKCLAGDAFAPSPPATPDQAHCNSLGEGFLAVGPGACVKISGYVSAGADVSAMVVKGAETSSPFAAASTLGGDAQSGTTAQTQVEAPLGPGRVYIQVGHSSP